MTDSRQLIDRIQHLNHQRLENVKGAHEDMLMTMLELKYEVQLPWETLWETRFQVGLEVSVLCSIELITSRCSIPFANVWQSRWASSRR